MNGKRRRTWDEYRSWRQGDRAADEAEQLGFAQSDRDLVSRGKTDPHAEAGWDSRFSWQRHMKDAHRRKDRT